MKAVDYEYRAVNLLQGEQASDNYKDVNPMGTVPSLTLDGVTVNDSMAIMELLEVMSVCVFPFGERGLCRKNTRNQQCCQRISSIERACAHCVNSSSPVFNRCRT